MISNEFSNEFKERKDVFLKQIGELDHLIESKLTRLNLIFKAREAQLERCGQLKEALNSNNRTIFEAKKLSGYKTQVHSIESCCCSSNACGYSKMPICFNCKTPIRRLDKTTSIPVYVPDLEERQLATNKRPALVKEFELASNNLAIMDARCITSSQQKSQLNNVKHKLSGINEAVINALSTLELNELTSDYEQLVKEIEACEVNTQKKSTTETSQQKSYLSRFFKFVFAEEDQEGSILLNYLDSISG